MSNCTEILVVRQIAEVLSATVVLVAVNEQ